MHAIDKKVSANELESVITYLEKKHVDKMGGLTGGGYSRPFVSDKQKGKASSGSRRKETKNNSTSRKSGAGSSSSNARENARSEYNRRSDN